MATIKHEINSSKFLFLISTTDYTHFAFTNIKLNNILNYQYQRSLGIIFLNDLLFVRLFSRHNFQNREDDGDMVDCYRFLIRAN